MIERAIMAWTGYWVGIGIEGGVILIAGVILVLMLTGVLFAWVAAIKAKSAANKEAAAERKAEREAQKQAEAEARAQARAEAEAAAAAAEAEAALAAEEEEAAVEEEPEAEEVVEEEPVEEVKPQPKKKKAAKKPVEEEEELPEDADVEVEANENGGDITIVHDGIVFNDSKTITELYEELSVEQKGYFDELREEALTKPNAELAISRNFITVKIGKRNLIKLLIKRGVTVAEFMIESEQLKALRLSNKNKRGKSSIKVKPTTVQVIDLMSLKVAVDMITLAYEDLMLDD